ncbi:hypothetical protein [Metabacillus idriensis]|uniref:hypothetical protein n=1 Tax=Metabacillus idriensis TaxID=324768 RepID=UPI00174E08EC|nr:hypothetical protein [Metabacillus idriensis]
MQILVSIHYFVNDIKSLRNGYFKVDEKKFKSDPDQEAAKVTYEWYRKIKREFIYPVTLHRALYDEIDITGKVKELEQWQLNQADE